MSSKEALDGEVVANLLDGRRRHHSSQEHLDVGGVDLLGDPARCHRHQQRVEAGHHPGALIADIGVPFGQQPQHLAVTHRRTERSCHSTVGDVAFTFPIWKVRATWRP